MYIVRQSSIYVYILEEEKNGQRINYYQKRLCHGLLNGYVFMKYGNTRGNGKEEVSIMERLKNEKIFSCRKQDSKELEIIML